jgi:hypothetical protein
VTAARRCSPRLLVDQLEATGGQIVEFWQAVDLDALGDPVTWVGPGPVPIWMDAARDFSEYWTHHQQICDALGRTGLRDPEYLGVGSALQVEVTGPGGGRWSCIRSPDRWVLQRRSHPRPAARLRLDPDIAWRLCTRGVTPETTAGHAHVDGDQRLASAALQIVSIIWTPPAAEASTS